MSSVKKLELLDKEKLRELYEKEREIYFNEQKKRKTIKNNIIKEKIFK